ncbi:MAG: ACP phosphodiesterase [Thermodesulfobacteriota bacterium]|nr:MAG: ACP phosphodiesterase [Thermodesulfobacteriota bacterium]
MNYLAHLYLAEDSDESLLGNLLGDFVKGRLKEQYSPEIIKGIKTHRKVDLYTDSHPNFLACKKLLQPERRRFAGIIVDMSFDHFLAKNWSDYSELELHDFTNRVYGVLLDHEPTLPQKLRDRLPYMIQDDWLGSYKNIDTVGLALNAISKRLSRFEKAKPIKDGLDDIKANYEEFEENFIEFFPDLISFVNDYRESNFSK